jgi:hypothetical protein
MEFRFSKLPSHQNKVKSNTPWKAAEALMQGTAQQQQDKWLP